VHVPYGSQMHVHSKNCSSEFWVHLIQCLIQWCQSLIACFYSPTITKSVTLHSSREQAAGSKLQPVSQFCLFPISNSWGSAPAIQPPFHRWWSSKPTVLTNRLCWGRKILQEWNLLHQWQMCANKSIWKENESMDTFTTTVQWSSQKNDFFLATLIFDKRVTYQ
jgi:hypothetical protein